MLQNKIAVVTGGTRGIGYAIVQKFLQNGAKVVLFGSREETVVKAVASLKEENPDWDVSGAWPKLTDAAAMADEIAKIKEKYGRIDILVNNAGILPKFKRFDRYSYDEIDKAMNINFYSCVYSTKTLLPIILESETPGIINIDSSAALMTLAGTSMYSASKAALKGFTEALRTEFKGKMYVGLVCPGFTKTDIFRNQGQTESNNKGAKVINMISTDCDLMVKMIMFGIEHKVPMQVHGLDAHAMSIFNRLMPVAGSELFSAIMKAAKVDLFDEVFRD